MKRFASRLIAMSLSALLVGGALASCNKPGEKPPVTGDKTIESSDSLRETTGKPEETTKLPEETTKHPEDTKNDEQKPGDTTPDDTKPEEPKPEEPNPEPIIEGPYRIDYLNNCPYEGSCTARLVLNPSWIEDFTIEIPANSPDGNLITHFSRWNNSFVGDCVPKILSEKTYQEAILKPLKEAAARGEMGSLSEGNFYVSKIDSYFQQKNPSEMKTNDEKEKCIRRYPITDPNGANIPIRVFSEYVSSVEILMVQNYLSKYISFSKDIVKADFAYFQDAIQKSPLNGTQKANLLLEYQYSENDHLVGLTLPDTLRGVQASDLINFKNLIQTENGVSYFGNWVIRVDRNLTSIELRDGTVGIAEGAISNGNYNLESMTIPASLKTICGDIAGGSSSFRKLYISDLAAWCAVRCTRYSYSGLCSAFRTAHDLYLNGELLTDLVIPDSVTSIDELAFSDCSSLTSITIGNGVTRIGDSAFRDCRSLTSVYITDLAKWCGISFESSDANPLYYAYQLYLNGTLITDLVIPDSVTSIGDYAFYDCSSLTSITIGNGVTSIGDYAFSGCSGLTSITVASGNPAYISAGNCLIETATKTLIAGCQNSLIPTDGSVTSIGERAFYHCSSLTSITIPDSVTSIGKDAFSRCSSLTRVYITDLAKWCGISFGSFDANPLCYAHNLYLNGTLITELVIPDSVTSIGERAFYDCSSLTSITIGNGVTSIGDEAFRDCSSLTSIMMGKGVTSIGDSAFYDCYSLTNITIPDSVTSIGDEAFHDCSSLTSIMIGNGVTRIGSYAFCGCRSLTGVYITDLAKWCGVSFGHSDANPLDYAHNLYLNGTLITELVIPDGVTSIGSYAFYYCSSLTSITIPDSVTSIGYNAFYYCSSLTSITVASGNPAYISAGNCLIETATKTLIAGCQNSLIPTDGSVTSIGERAFYDCSRLASITIPDSVTSIGEWAFSDCSRLTSITIGNGVTSIGECAFYNCGSLTSITIPDSVTSIGGSAFFGCRRLTSITIGNGVTRIGSYAFSGCSSLTSITFNGTKAQWNAITEDFAWNFNTGNYTVHCTDGDIEKQS